MRALLAVLALALAPGLALAQDPAPREVAPIIITASPPRPHAMYVLTRSRPRFDRVDDAHHSVDRIVDSVTRAPF
jgi:hypothetical protein